MNFTDSGICSFNSFIDSFKPISINFPFFSATHKSMVKALLVGCDKANTSPIILLLYFRKMPIIEVGIFDKQKTKRRGKKNLCLAGNRTSEILDVNLLRVL